jgi:hypothetical protein
MPASFATNMALGVLIAFVVIGARGNPRWLRSLAIAGTPLMGAGLAASGSRGPLVILVLGLAVVAALRRGRSAVPILILGAATVWAATSLTTNLISLRYARLLDLSYVNGRWIEPLCRGLTIAAEHPLGMGLGYTAGMPVLSRVLTRGATTSDRFAPDSAFAGIQTTNVDSGIGGAAAELGFPGVLIFLFLLVQLALCPLRSWRQIADPSLKELLLAPVSFALVFAMTAVVWPITASLPMSIYFWVLIGMALKAPHLNTEPGEVGEPPTPEAAPRVAPAGRLVSDAP